MSEKDDRVSELVTPISALQLVFASHLPRQAQADV